MSTSPDVNDTEVVVSLGGQVLGTFPVDYTIGTALYDNYGTASVSVQLPADAAGRSGRARAHGCGDGN